MNYATDTISGAKLGQPMPEQSSLQGAISSVSNGVNDLHCALDVLAMKLVGVLQPEAPTPAPVTGGGARQVESPHSPVVDELHNIRLRIERAVCAVNLLTKRCEA